MTIDPTVHLRIARPVTQLARSVAMYCAGLGLEVIGSFEGHDGFDGVMLGLEGASWHLELTVCRTHPVKPSNTPEDLVVYYLPDTARWREACTRAENAGFIEVESFNPYWARNGRTFEDRDGYRVVLQNASWTNVEQEPKRQALSEDDLAHLRATFRSAQDAAQKGNAPFGARLVGADGVVHFDAGNQVATSHDSTAHAEIVLIRQASATLSAETLRGATLFTSAEPCAMCAGAISWIGIGRVVYGLSARRVRELDGAVPTEPGVPGHIVLANATHHPVVDGPALEDEAARLLFPAI